MVQLSRAHIPHWVVHVNAFGGQRRYLVMTLRLTRRLGGLVLRPLFADFAVRGRVAIREPNRARSNALLRLIEGAFRLGGASTVLYDDTTIRGRCAVLMFCCAVVPSSIQLLGCLK
jgi:hypothetical protein